LDAGNRGYISAWRPYGLKKLSGETVKRLLQKGGALCSEEGPEEERAQMAFPDPLNCLEVPVKV
jgi:hypothetical protein